MKPITFSLNHLGIYVTDIDMMTDFYTSFFGFVVTDRRDNVNPIRFMTMSPNEHHQLLLASGRQPGAPTTVNQISFLLEDFAALRRVYERASSDKRVPKIWSLDHGNSWALYFSDPEGNTIECYVHTPWHVSQPYGVPIDFSLSDAEIWRKTEAAALANPSYKPAEDFRTELAQKLEAARV
ncbi:MAG TPA: VOC family protein [Caulobacterales bacterium]|nr:VOC family protein [Caulobacterales bacterium]